MVHKNKKSQVQHKIVFHTLNCHCSTRTCYDLVGKAGRLWAIQCCQA